MKRERILERHDDVGTVGYKLYADSEGKLYADPGFKNPLTAEEVANAFVKGCVVSKEGVLSRPAALNADGTLSFGGGGGQKLYRHDILLSADQNSCIFSVGFVIYNTDPTNYTKSFLVFIDEENWELDWDNSFNCTEEDLAFIPGHSIPAYGCFADNPDGADMRDIVSVRAIKNGIEVGYTLETDPEGLYVIGLTSISTYTTGDIEKIDDIVTEVM